MSYEFTELSAKFATIYDSNPTPEAGKVIGVQEDGVVYLRASGGTEWYDVPNAQQSALVLFGATYVSSTEPSADSGEIWYDTGSNEPKVYYNNQFYTIQ